MGSGSMRLRMFSTGGALGLRASLYVRRRILEAAEPRQNIHVAPSGEADYAERISPHACT